MTNKAEEFFNVDDPESGIHRELAPGLNAQVFVGDNSMLSLVRFVPGGTGEIHSHSEEQWGLLLEGSGTRIQNGKRTIWAGLSQSIVRSMIRHPFGDEQIKQK